MDGEGLGKSNEPRTAAPNRIIGTKIQTSSLNVEEEEEEEEKKENEGRLSGKRDEGKERRKSNQVIGKLSSTNCSW